MTQSLPLKLFWLQLEKMAISLLFFFPSKEENSGFHPCPNLCLLVAQENNIFLLSRAKPLISTLKFPAADRFLQQVIFSPLSPGYFATLEHVRAGAEMKGPRLCQLHWGPGHWRSNFLMNMEAKDLKGRSGFPERRIQYVSGLLNPEHEAINVLPIAITPRSSGLP